MPDSFKADAEWERDLNEFFELLRSGTAASYIEQIAELKARKGDVYASAIEAEAMKRHRGARKEANQLVPKRESGRSLSDDETPSQEKESLKDMLFEYGIEIEQAVRELWSVDDYDFERQWALHIEIRECENKINELKSKLSTEVVSATLINARDCLEKPISRRKIAINKITPQQEQDGLANLFKSLYTARYILMDDLADLSNSSGYEYEEMEDESKDYWSRIEKLRAFAVTKHDATYVATAEKDGIKKARERMRECEVTKKWECEYKLELEEQECRRKEDLLKKERAEFIQQLGNAISTPIVGAMLSMNTANQAQFERMYSNFENTYRQVSFEVVTAINEQNGQYFEKLENSLENTLKSCTSANLEGLERAATMISRAVNGPIPPRQSNEDVISWAIRMYAQQACIAPIVPRQEGEGFGSYFARTIAQQDSVTPILPRSPRENIINYLVRLKVTQTL